MKDSDKETVFLKLIAGHKNQIHRICWGFTSNTEEIKDLYQEVIINIWKGLEGFNHKSTHSTWIHRITINTCLFWKKKNSSFQELKQKSPLTDQNHTEQIELVENEQLKALKKAIDQLKVVDKTLTLLVLEELSYKEISEVTGLTVSNIGVKINRIKGRLKKILDKSQNYG